MATIQENIETIKSATADIKTAIVDKGGTIEGDITTWAGAISALSGGIEPKLTLATSDNNKKLFEFCQALSNTTTPLTLPIIISMAAIVSGYISITDRAGTTQLRLFQDGSTSIIDMSGSDD